MNPRSTAQHPAADRAIAGQHQHQGGPAHVGAPTSPSWPAAAADLISTFATLFTDFSTDHARMQPHGVNKRSGTPYKKYVRQKGKPITPELIGEHLAGRLTLATQPQRDGQARAIAFDLDHGQDLQATIEHLGRLGLWAFAVASSSADADGAPTHQGGHVWILSDHAASAAALLAAGQALADRLGLATSEIWPRAGVDLRLPFGRNLRAVAGREWGTLYLPQAAPLKLTSGAQGLAAMLAAYRPNSLVGILAFAPQAPQTSPFAPGRTKTPTSDTLDSARLIQTYNERIDVRTVLESFGAIPSGAGSWRYCCACGNHTKGHEDSLVVGEWSRPGYCVRVWGSRCKLYGKTHDAFSVMQTLGGYTRPQALDEARRQLSMPAFEPARPAPRPNERPAPTAPIVHDAPMVMLAAQLRAVRDGSLTKTTRRVLGLLLDASAGTGWCQLSLRAIHLAAECAEATARTSLYTLRDKGYIIIDTSANAFGGSLPNYFIFANPLSAPQKPAAADSMGGGLIFGSPVMELNTQYGGGISAPASSEYAADGEHLVSSEQLADVGPMDAGEWESLYALAPLPDELEHEPAGDYSPPRTVAPGPLAAAAAPAIVAADSPAPAAPPAAALPADHAADYVPGAPIAAPVSSQQARKILKSQPIAYAATPRYAGKPGPNVAALAILMAMPGYVPDEPDMPAPLPPAEIPAIPGIDPPAALLDQAAALITDGRFSEYESLKAQHPGYDWASGPDLRPSYRRWRAQHDPAPARGHLVGYDAPQSRFTIAA